MNETFNREAQKAIIFIEEFQNFGVGKNLSSPIEILQNDYLDIWFDAPNADEDMKSEINQIKEIVNELKSLFRKLIYKERSDEFDQEKDKVESEFGVLVWRMMRITMNTKESNNGF